MNYTVSFSLGAKTIVFACCGLVLSGMAATPFTPTTGADIAQSVADAKAAWTSTSESQEIVLAKGLYEIPAEIVLDFPVVFRGATGNPADATVKHLNTGANKYRVFTLDDPGARLLSVTVTGGSLDCLTGKYSRLGAGVRISKSTVDGSDSSAGSNKGKGGTVSNCVFTANSITYKNDSAIVYVNGPADKTLVTCCVITNNSCRRQNDSSGGSAALGSIVHVDSGRFTSSIVANNAAYNSTSTDKQDLTSVIEARGGSIENCLVTGNRVYTSYDPTVARTVGSGKIYNTVIAGNSVSTSSWSRADWPETSRYWAGVESGFVNCVVQGEDITMPNVTCFCTNDLGYFDYAAHDYRLCRFSPLRAAGETNGVLTTGLDLLGKPRVDADGNLDIGPIAYDPSIVKLAGECLTQTCFDDERASFRVTVDEGFGDEPQYYWTLTNPTGSVTYSTSSPDFSTLLGPGDYSVKLSVSNLTVGTGASVLLDTGVTVHQRRFYAKPNNAGAAAPYATEETAAADLQTAINAVTRDGAEVVALPGVYEIVTNVLVRKNQIVLRGSTGNPEDVVVRNTTEKKWKGSEYDESKSDGEGRCLVLDAGPGASVESMTFENGKGLYSINYGCGLYLGSWTSRSSWPGKGKGGVVSNCVVRGSYASGKYGVAAGIFANGSDYFITHTVITNCMSGAGNVNGGKFCGVGLELGGGARAEHCLIANNTTTFYKRSDRNYPEYGRGTVGGVMVRDTSVIRFSTVANNVGAMVGGVNLNGSNARMENCIVLGNTTMDESLSCAVTTNRYHCWAMMTYPANDELLDSGDKTRNPSGATWWASDKIAELTAAEVAYVEAHPEAVDAGFRNTMTDWAVAGTTGILSTPAETFRNAAKRNYRLKGCSPAVDRVPPAEAGVMPAVDILGQPRLFGDKYDLGCHESQCFGLLMIFK